MQQQLRHLCYDNSSFPLSSLLTCACVQRAVREAFAECTVLTVAHRLHTIIDYDRILVLADGQALEFGTPQDLMQVWACLRLPRVLKAAGI